MDTLFRLYYVVYVCMYMYIVYYVPTIILFSFEISFFVYNTDKILQDFRIRRCVNSENIREWIIVVKRVVMASVTVKMFGYCGF